MNAILSWLKTAMATFFGYVEGKSAGVTEQKNKEAAQDVATSQAVAKASADAPATPAAVSSRLRNDSF